MFNRIKKTFSLANFTFGSSTSKKKDSLKQNDTKIIDENGASVSVLDSRNRNNDSSKRTSESNFSDSMEKSATLHSPVNLSEDSEVPSELLPFKEIWNANQTLPSFPYSPSAVVADDDEDPDEPPNTGSPFDNHDFHVFDEETVTFCDVCLQVLRVNIHSRRCNRCKLTCHAECCTKKNLSKTECKIPSQLQSGLSSTTSLDAISDNAADNAALENVDPQDGMTMRQPAGQLLLPTDQEPAFVKLLPSMTFHASTLDNFFKSDEWSSLTSVSTLPDSLRTASITAVSTPYDLSTCDKESLHRYGIQIKVDKSLSSSSNLLYESSGKLTSGISSPCVLTSSGITSQGLHFAHESTHWDLHELQRRMDIFNTNSLGLSVKLKAIVDDPSNNAQSAAALYKCTGTIRVHIIFIRTVRLAYASARPLSTFDFVSKDPSEADYDVANNTKPEWLPRGIPKLLYIDITMTTQEVIEALLQKFLIKDNPRKFALYEHTIEGDKEVRVRKLLDEECPLLLTLTWTAQSIEDFNAKLLVKRLVLQENETNDIDWTAFSVPELQNFLNILSREEEEYKRQIRDKFQKRQLELERLLQHSEQFKSNVVERHA